MGLFYLHTLVMTNKLKYLGKIICRGSMVLGTGCGWCIKCADEVLDNNLDTPVKTYTIEELTALQHKVDAYETYIARIEYLINCKRTDGVDAWTDAMIVSMLEAHPITIEASKRRAHSNGT